MLALCKKVLREDKPQEVLEAAIRIARKERRKKPRPPSPLRISKEETYKIVTKNDLTEKQLKGLREHMLTKQVCIICFKKLF